MKIFFKETLKLSLLVSVATLAVFAATYAQTWNPAPTPPPSNNAPEPVNISAVTQSKLGNFTGNVIGANGFCLPGSLPTGGCISAWPATTTATTTVSSDIKIVQSAISNTTPGSATASCGAGYKVVGGGWERVFTNETTQMNIIYNIRRNYPNTDSSWRVETTDYVPYKAYAVCLKVS